MRFKIHRDQFSNGLAQVLNVVGSKPTMAILRNVLIEASNGRVTLTTTNLDLGIRCSIQAEVEESGGLTLPVRKLASIVREMPGLDLLFETDAQHNARISSGSSQFRMVGLGQDDFPPFPQFSEDRRFPIGQQQFQRMLRSVSFAQSNDENRYILNGVLVHFEGPRLTLAATDGRRLAVARIEPDDLPEEEAGQIILPAKTVAELERLLGQGDSVTVSFNDRQAAFEIALGDGAVDTGLTEKISLVTKIVEGKYPDYQQVVPRELEHRIKVDRELLLESVRRAALVVSEKNHSIQLAFSANLLEIKGESNEYGESHETVAIQYEGEPIRIAFNPQFLIDPLRSLTNDEVFFEFKDEFSPGVFRTLEGFLCVVMPLRLG